MDKIYLVIEVGIDDDGEVVAAYRSEAEAEKAADSYNERPGRHYYQYIKEIDIID